MAIKYIDPDLGERTLIVFSLSAHQQELARLKKLGYKITHPSGDSTNAPAMKFTDPCYPPQLVDLMNEILERDDLNAVEQWYWICEAEHNCYSHKDDPCFEGLPHQLCLETAPREFLLSIIRAKRTRGYEWLMEAFGMAA